MWPGSKVKKGNARQAPGLCVGSYTADPQQQDGDEQSVFHHSMT